MKEKNEAARLEPWTCDDDETTTTRFDRHSRTPRVMAAAADSGASKAPARTVYILCSGFGKFAGVPVNPTTILMGRLNRDDCPKLGSDTVLHSARIVETSSVAATEAVLDMTRIGRELLAANPGAAVVLVHFGVHGGSRTFRLEQVGHNDASFAVPDERCVVCSRKRAVGRSERGTRATRRGVGVPGPATKDDEDDDEHRRRRRRGRTLRASTRCFE